VAEFWRRNFHGECPETFLVENVRDLRGNFLGLCSGEFFREGVIFHAEMSREMLGDELFEHMFGFPCRITRVCV